MEPGTLFVTRNKYLILWSGASNGEGFTGHHTYIDEGKIVALLCTVTMNSTGCTDPAVLCMCGTTMGGRGRRTSSTASEPLTGHTVEA